MARRLSWSTLERRAVNRNEVSDATKAEEILSPFYSRNEAIQPNPIKICFAADWLERIEGLFPNDKFHFYIDGKDYSCHPLLACCLSERVSRLLKLDATADSLYLKTKDERNLFESLFNTLKGTAFYINRLNWDFFYAIGRELDNPEIVASAVKISTSGMTVESSIDSAIKSYRAGADYEVFVDFLASHISEATEMEHFKDLPIPVLSAICESDMLPHESCENELFTAIANLPDPKPLVKYINPDFLSDGLFTQYLSLVDLQDLDWDIWTLVRQRFASMQRGLEESRDTDTPTCIRYKGTGHELDGIFAKMTRDNNGKNVMTSGVIDCDVGSYIGRLGFLLDGLKNETECWGGDTPDTSIITFDFKGRRVEMSHYTLMTCACAWNKYPRSWEMYGSNDNDNWVLIDKQTNDPDMIQKNFAKTFKLKKTSAPFRYIQWRPLSNYAEDRVNFFVRLKRIEFFGKLLAVEE